MPPHGGTSEGTSHTQRQGGGLPSRLALKQTMVIFLCLALVLFVVENSQQPLLGLRRGYEAQEHVVMLGQPTRRRATDGDVEGNDRTSVGGVRSGSSDHGGGDGGGGGSNGGGTAAEKELGRPKERCPPCEKKDSPSAEQPAATATTISTSPLTPHQGRAKPGEALGARGSVWQDKGFHLYPFKDMFYPYNETVAGDRSIVMFTGGRSGMDNIDQLVRLWGNEDYDYVLLHFDDSAGEWRKFPWYKDVVAVTVQKQAKFWYYKRFAHPWLVKGYRYVHFVDSDAGSPPEQPFHLKQYEAMLSAFNVKIGQPAISPKGRSSDHAICRVNDQTLLRWTTVVENGPFYSVAREAYECYWELMSADMVSGWGPDAAWCPYLYEVCGYPKEESCAVVDVTYIDHLDKKTASGHKYRGRDYWEYGFQEWAAYEKRLSPLLTSEFQKTAGHFGTIKEVSRPDGWKLGQALPTSVTPKKKASGEVKTVQDRAQTDRPKGGGENGEPGFEKPKQVSSPQAKDQTHKAKPGSRPPPLPEATGAGEHPVSAKAAAGAEAMATQRERERDRARRRWRAARRRLGALR